MNMINVDEIIELQVRTVERWHQRAIDNPYEGLNKTICTQHSLNFLLWHEEDIARKTDVSDSEIARVKRTIDKYNQQRNDWIEQVDDEIASMLESSGVTAAEDARLNTETPGCTIDRLSILSLRIYHMHEQLERHDVPAKHIESVRQKLSICLLQQNDVKTSLGQLLDDIFSGQKRHRTFRQFKMYNDTTLNPYLYKTKQPTAISSATVGTT